MEHTPAVERSPEHETTTGIDHRKMLIWVFLGSECMFFGSLIATYLIYYGQSVSGPTPADILDIPTTTVSTFVLLMSSFMMVMAYSNIRRGNVRNFRIWILCTAFLGATFLGFPGLRVQGVRHSRRSYAPDQPVRKHLLHPDGIPRRARNPRSGLACIAIRLLLQGRPHSPGGFERRYSRPVLALCGRCVDCDIHCDLPDRGDQLMSGRLLATVVCEEMSYVE